jgi:RNA-binding protein 26
VVFADYIIALLRHDKTTIELKQECKEQLVDFLTEGKTEEFVEQLFQVLENKSYVDQDDIMDYDSDREYRSRSQSRSPDRRNYRSDDEASRDRYTRRNVDRDQRTSYTRDRDGPRRGRYHSDNKRRDHDEKRDDRKDDKRGGFGQRGNKGMKRYGHVSDRSPCLIVENIPPESFTLEIIFHALVNW